MLRVAPADTHGILLEMVQSLKDADFDVMIKVNVHDGDNSVVLNLSPKSLLQMMDDNTGISYQIISVK